MNLSREILLQRELIRLIKKEDYASAVKVRDELSQWRLNNRREKEALIDYLDAQDILKL